MFIIVKMQRKLQAAENSNEALTLQVQQLHDNDNLQKLRQQYDSAIESLQQKHQEEILQMKVELDASCKAVQSQVCVCVFVNVCVCVCSCACVRACTLVCVCVSPQQLFTLFLKCSPF